MHNLTCIHLIQFLNKTGYVSRYSIPIHYIPHLFPIYGIKTLQTPDKGLSGTHALFHNYTLFILFPCRLLGPHVMWVPCHYSIAHLQFADGEDGLQLWRVDANKLNKQLQTAHKECATGRFLVLISVKGCRPQGQSAPGRIA
jgi:hypothetical protein